MALTLCSQTSCLAGILTKGTGGSKASARTQGEGSKSSAYLESMGRRPWGRGREMEEPTFHSVHIGQRTVP